MANQGFGGTLRATALSRIAMGLFTAAFIFSACSSGASPSPAAPSVGAPSAAAPSAAAPSAAAPSSAAPSAAASQASCAADPDAGLAALATTVASTGPFGETPTNPNEVTLTPEELAKVKAMNATAAIVMHYGRQRLVEGPGPRPAKTRSTTMGIKVIAVTDAELQGREAGLGHRDRAGPEAEHHRLHPVDPGRRAGAYQRPSTRA